MFVRTRYNALIVQVLLLTDTKVRVLCVLGYFFFWPLASSAYSVRVVVWGQLGIGGLALLLCCSRLRINAGDINRTENIHRMPSVLGITVKQAALYTQNRQIALSVRQTYWKSQEKQAALYTQNRQIAHSVAGTKMKRKAVRTDVRETGGCLCVPLVDNISEIKTYL